MSLYGRKIKGIAVTTVLTMALTLSLPTLSPAEATFGQSSDLFNIGAGARAMAMGSAFTGLADDAAAPYFNPAGLAHLDEHQLMAMHAPLFLNSSFNYLSSAHPFGDKWGSLAISDARLHTDGIEQRDQFNAVTDGNAIVSHNALFVSYAHKLPWNLSAGINGKFIQQKVANISGDTIGVDLGFLYKPHRFFSAGVLFANANKPEITLNTSPDEFRPLTRIGFGSEVFQDRLTLTADLIKITQQDTLYAAGFEFTPTRLFQLRGGYNADRSYTLGLGVNVHPFRIDYAFSDTDLGSFSKFSFTWAWHNIYKTEIDPPMKEGRAVYPLAGFENKVVFLPYVPNHVVARWSLKIQDGEGNVVRTLEADLRPPHQINWDALNEYGEPVVDGLYRYTFDVKYKNGKSWVVKGHIDLALPNHTIEEVIDMNLQLNGAQGEDEASLLPTQDTTIVTLEENTEKIEAPIIEPTEETTQTTEPEQNETQQGRSE